MNAIDRHDERLAIYYRDKGTCQSCGNPAPFVEMELAHKIADTKPNRKKYGARVIDHPLNRTVTHRGACNDKQNIGFNPVEAEKLVSEIRGEFVQ